MQYPCTVPGQCAMRSRGARGRGVSAGARGRGRRGVPASAAGDGGMSYGPGGLLKADPVTEGGGAASARLLVTRPAAQRGPPPCLRLSWLSHPRPSSHACAASFVVGGCSHEAPQTGGFGAEVAAEVARRWAGLRERAGRGGKGEGWGRAPLAGHRKCRMPTARQKACACVIMCVRARSHCQRQRVRMQV